MKYEKRTYQEEAVEKCVNAFLGKNHTSVMLESPVGSGKTYMALETIHRFQDRLGRRILVNWVAPRHHLLQQMVEANMSLYQDDVIPVSLFDRRPPKADFVVLDEAHHEATQSCVLLYEKMRNTWTLGLSATPMRTDRMKLSFQETVRTCPIGRLIREGYLSPFNSYVIPKYSVDEIARFYLAEAKRWGKSIAFFSTIAECVKFREILVGSGTLCEVVTGESDKDRQLEVFANGMVPIVANVAMLTEGFDQPDVRTVFARDASRLPTIQMCGRGLRLAPGKDACNIVQSANTSYKFEHVCSPKNAFRFQDGRWLALTDGTEEINRTVEETLRRIAKVRERDKKERKDEYRNAKAVAAEKFERRLARIEEETRRAESYYSDANLLYRQLYRLYSFVNVTCWGGQLPEVVINLRKDAGSSREVAGAVRNFARIGEKLYPSIFLNLQNCKALTARRIAIAIMHATIHLWQLENGQEAGHGKDFKDEFDKIGLDEESNLYCKGSMAEQVFHEVDNKHSTIVARLMAALMHEFKNTGKGDIKFFKAKIKKTCGVM